MRKQIAALRHAEVEAADSRPPPDLDYPFAVGRTSISDAPALAGLVRQNQALLEEVRQLRDVVGELQERSGSDGMPSAPPPAPTEAPASPRTRRGLSAYQRQYDQVQELQAELARVYEQVREQHAELALSHSRSSAQTDETKQLKVASHLLKARAHASLVRVRTTEEQRNTLAEQLEFKRVEDAWQEATLRTALREVRIAHPSRNPWKLRCMSLSWALVRVHRCSGGGCGGRRAAACTRDGADARACRQDARGGARRARAAGGHGGLRRARAQGGER